MKYKLARELKEARPGLRSVSPVSYWFILIMGIFNLILGASFILAIDGAKLDETLNVITAIVPIWAWAVLFSGLGFLKLYALAANNWTLARYSLLTGVMLKSGWAVALMIRTLEIPDNIFLSLTWVTISLVQMICYIHFLPPSEPRKLDGEIINE